MLNFKRTVFSDDRIYRYTLWREWDAANPTFCNFICLNPSTADETHDDPTIRKCIGFAKRWKFGAFCMTNLFAFRATQPKDMMCSTNPEGPDNRMWLMEVAKNASIVVIAWGNDGAYRQKGAEVRRRLFNLHIPFHYLHTNKNGEPSHPLYQPGSTVLSAGGITIW